jgi:MFS family permease
VTVREAGIVFVFIGSAISGGNIGLIIYVLEIAPPSLRTSYIAVSGTLNGLLALLPVVDGWVVDAGSYRLAFWIALGFDVVALTSTLKLTCLRPGDRNWHPEPKRP